MKSLFTLTVALLIAATLLGQVPESFKYQAVLRDARGNIRANTQTNINIDILQSGTTGAAVYSETFYAITDDYGLINLEIGNGIPSKGTISDIDWGKGTYYIKVTVDGIVMGAAQLLSVPYALYAKNAGVLCEKGYKGDHGVKGEVGNLGIAGVAGEKGE